MAKHLFGGSSSSRRQQLQRVPPERSIALLLCSWTPTKPSGPHLFPGFRGRMPGQSLIGRLPWFCALHPPPILVSTLNDRVITRNDTNLGSRTVEAGRKVTAERPRESRKLRAEDSSHSIFKGSLAILQRHPDSGTLLGIGTVERKYSEISIKCKCASLIWM